MIAKISDIEDDTIVVELYDLEFDDIIELHSNIFQTLLDSVPILLSIVMLSVKFEDDRCFCL